MENIYLYTDAKCTKVLEVRVFDGDIDDSPGKKAIRHLIKKHPKGTVAWSRMGGDNPMPIWPKK